METPATPQIVHKSVLLHEVIAGLEIKHTDTVLDATLGGGGHSAEALQCLGEHGTLIALDADTQALRRSEERLKHIASKRGTRLVLVQANFRHLDTVLSSYSIRMVDKYIFDLGLSSQEIEESGRGFTFRNNEPLLMTFASEITEETLTARDIVNTWEEENIALIIKSYGEERYARRIAKAIVASRKVKPIETTFDLVEIILSATPHAYHHGSIHPATRTFQALRMTVNDETEALKESLRKAFDHLSSGGRIAVISFHSIEDRIVKHFFKERIAEGIAVGITKKPITPTNEEISHNPRSRSAKLRIVSKV